MNASVQPDLTVVIACPQRHLTLLERTVESALRQAGISLELVVAAEHGTDSGSAELQRLRGDKRVRVVTGDEPAGASRLLGRNLRRGSGRYVAVLSAGDIVYPGHFAKLIEALDRHLPAALAYAQCTSIDEAGGVTRGPDLPGHLPQSYVGGRDELADLLRSGNYLAVGASVFRRSLIDAIAADAEADSSDDVGAYEWEWATRVARRFPDFVFIRETGVGRFSHTLEAQTDRLGEARALADHTRILELNLADAPTRVRMRHAALSIWGSYLARIAATPERARADYAARGVAIRHALFANAASHVAADNKPFFSIVLAVEENLSQLSIALEAIAAQRSRDFEIVITNDGGYPAEQIARATNLPVKYVFTSNKRGLTAARESGDQLAQGRFVLHLDQFAQSNPDFLGALAAHLVE